MCEDMGGGSSELLRGSCSHKIYIDIDIFIHVCMYLCVYLSLEYILGSHALQMNMKIDSVF